MCKGDERKMAFSAMSRHYEYYHAIWFILHTHCGLVPDSRRAGGHAQEVYHLLHR